MFWTISSKLKAFIERFYCIAEEDPNPPLGRYEKYPVKDAALLMTSADDLFWTYEQAVSYYKFTVINYIGFHDKGMILAGGCGDTNGKPQIDKIDYLKKHMDLEKQFIMNNINRNLQNYKERIHIMEGRLIAFVIWVIIGVLFIVMGIYDFNSKKAKPFGFWANAEVAPIEDVKGYNRALGILWCVYGVLFTLIGLPLLDGQNSGLIIIPILGAMLISIAAMVAYVVGIEPKYRKKK